MTTRDPRRIRPAALGLVVALLALTGCTDTGARADGSGAHHSPVTATHATHVEPFTHEGRPAPGFTVVDHAAAKCSASGVNLSDPDARRCMTTEGYFLYDPCFVRHHPRPDVALCVQNPTTSQAMHIRIVEDTAAPADGERPGRPWFLELADGRHCVPAPGPGRGPGSGSDSGRPTYTCGSDDHLYGPPDTTRPVWTITDRPAGADAPGAPQRVRIRTAWL
ncbi:hypothetical protein [Prauserella aidingensis]|uniref:hypothetical protein n=1 Tax=Prauserella aidingensis TaxID=387890 RepID=UPI0020A4F89E|nr:hypothetical protein [Prauserella aidingensis]